MTTIFITKETKDKLARKGLFGQSYEDIIKKMLIELEGKIESSN